MLTRTNLTHDIPRKVYVNHPEPSTRLSSATTTIIGGVQSPSASPSIWEPEDLLEAQSSCSALELGDVIT